MDREARLALFKENGTRGVGAHPGPSEWEQRVRLPFGFLLLLLQLEELSATTPSEEG